MSVWMCVIFCKCLSEMLRVKLHRLSFMSLMAAKDVPSLEPGPDRLLNLY